MKILVQLSLFIVLSILGFSCIHNSESRPEGNLIANSGFESNGDSSFEGWNGLQYNFINDTPDNGDEWSLELKPAWFPDEGFAETSVTGLEGTYNFLLTCDTKTINWTGDITVLLSRTDESITELNHLSFVNTEWNIQTLVFNASLNETDKVIVHLSAGSTEVASGSVLFDNVSLMIE